MNAKPTPSPRRLIVSGSQSQWDSVNVIDNRAPSFATRRPGGSAPNRLDTSSPLATELDIALGFAIHDDNHDDNMSIGSPSVATAVTGNVSQVTPDDKLPIDNGRERRGRCNSSGRARQRQHGRTTRRETSPDSRRLALGGSVVFNDEIRASMRDVTDSVRQIITTVRRFGPDEREAVRDTLLDARNFVSAVLLPGCGRADVDVTDSVDFSDRRRSSSVQDSKINGNTRMRRDRADSRTSRRGRVSSLRDDRRSASRDVRRRKKEKAEECSDMVVEGGKEVVHNLPVVNNFERARMIV
jgi:hypothetical protein